MRSNGRPDTARTASSSRIDGDNGSRTMPPVKPTICVSASVAAVISAMAADASRGVSDDPATRPAAIDPDTSSASSNRLPVGSTALNAV